jgi:protein phosphatase 1 regulatory subunit 11
MTITQDDTTAIEAPILRLTLRPPPHVSWDEGVINNEGMGRKSSKRCCIFHKQRAFGESSTESSENDSGDDGSTSSSSSGGGGSGKARRPMTQKKKKKSGKVGKPKVPDYQRFHA